MYVSPCKLPVLQNIQASPYGTKVILNLTAAPLPSHMFWNNPWSKPQNYNCVGFHVNQSIIYFVCCPALRLVNHVSVFLQYNYLLILCQVQTNGFHASLNIFGVGNLQTGFKLTWTDFIIKFFINVQLLSLWLCPHKHLKYIVNTSASQEVPY